MILLANHLVIRLFLPRDDMGHVGLLANHLVLWLFLPMGFIIFLTDTAFEMLCRDT